MAVSRVTRNFQVTVPREIRELANIRVGDTLLFVKEHGDEVIIRKVNRDLLGNSFGIWKKAQEKTPWLVNRLLKGDAERRLKNLKM